MSIESKEALANKLREAGLDVEDWEGFFRGTFSDGERSQLWLIDYDADDWGGHAEYDFLSPCGSAEDPAHVKAACEMAGQKKRGGIVVLWDKIFFKIEVGTDLDADSTRNQLEFACKIADTIEAATVGGDEF